MSDHVYDLGPVISHGRWVVRWIDEIPRHSATGDDPQAWFWFSRISNPAWRDVPFIKAIEGPPPPPPFKSTAPTFARIVFTNLHVGALTDLRIGMVVDNGKPIGWLNAEESDEDYVFELPRALPGPRRGLFPANTPAREVLGVDIDGHLMPKNAYRHGCRPDTFVTVLRDPSGQGRPLIIPSSEVIRAFLAPVSDVAQALVRLPPPYQLSEIIRSSTAVTGQNHWRLDLAATIPARYAPLIANLYGPFSPFGAMAAAEVFSTKQDDLALRQGGFPRTARLAGMIPFTDCTLRFRAKVIPLSDHHDLCVEITKVTWPYPDRPPIEVIRWKAEPEPGQTAKMVPATRLQTRSGVETTIDPNNDSDIRSDVTSFEVPGVVWEALPKPTPAEIKFRPAWENQAFPGETQRSDEASLGTGKCGTGVPKGSLVSVPNGDKLGEPCPRFAAVALMLTEQKRGGGICDFEVVAPQAGRREAKRGDLGVWRLGPKGDFAPGWFWMDEVRGIRRTLLVYKITLVSGRIVFWLDLEPKNDRKVFASLLVAPTERWEDGALEYLVRRIELDKRVTQVVVDPEWLQHARMRRWFHHRANQPLDGGRAVQDMSALVASA